MTIFYQSNNGYTRQWSLVFEWNLQTNGKLLDFPKSGYDWMFTGGDDWSDLLPPYYIQYLLLVCSVVWLYHRQKESRSSTFFLPLYTRAAHAAAQNQRLSEVSK